MALIELKNVTFSYSNNSKKVLNNVSLSMEEGKSYAFVGPTGEGKSTTASLIARLYLPTEGEIIFDGKNLNDYDQSELYSQIGFILQDPFLFSGTVLDNLVYGNEDLIRFWELDDKSDDYPPKISQFEKILRNKELLALLSVFPDGLKTVVNNSSENISLGQKQIINFMRIILRSPKFLILDEATANLDTVTESQLQKILNTLPDTTTKMIIAHRLNTIKDVDTVFLVGGGDIIVNT